MGLALTRQPTLLLYSHQKHKLPESANWGFHTARGRQIFWRWRQIWHDTNEERQKTVQSVFAFVSKFWRRVICVNRPPQSFKVCTADLGGLGDGLSLAWSGALIPPPPRKKENCSLEFTLHLNNDFRALSRDWGAPEPWPDPESVAPPPPSAARWASHVTLILDPLGLSVDFHVACKHQDLSALSHWTTPGHQCLHRIFLGIVHVFIHSGNLALIATETSQDFSHCISHWTTRHHKLYMSCACHGLLSPSVCKRAWFLSLCNVSEAHIPNKYQEKQSLWLVLQLKTSQSLTRAAACPGPTLFRAPHFMVSSTFLELSNSEGESWRSFIWQVVNPTVTKVW